MFACLPPTTRSYQRGKSDAGVSAAFSEHGKSEAFSDYGLLCAGFFAAFVWLVLDLRAALLRRVDAFSVSGSFLAAAPDCESAVLVSRGITNVRRRSNMTLGPSYFEQPTGPDRGLNMRKHRACAKLCARCRVLNCISFVYAR